MISRSGFWPGFGGSSSSSLGLSRGVTARFFSSRLLYLLKCKHNEISIRFYWDSYPFKTAKMCFNQEIMMVLGNGQADVESCWVDQYDNLNKILTSLWGWSGPDQSAFCLIIAKHFQFFNMVTNFINLVKNPNVFLRKRENMPDVSFIT